MTLNLQDFQPSSSSESEAEIPQEAEVISQEVQIPSTQSEESPKKEIIQTPEAFDPPEPIADTNRKEVSKEALQALTKELFEKIAKSANVPSKSNKEKIAEKKVTPSEVLEKKLLAKQAKKPIEQKRLSKTVSQDEKLAKEKRLDDNLRKEAFLKAQEKKQEMLAKEKAFIEEQECLAKKEEKAKKLAEEEAEKIARAEATLAQQEQIRKMEEAKAQKAIRTAQAQKAQSIHEQILQEQKQKALREEQKRKLLQQKHLTATKAKEKRKIERAQKEKARRAKAQAKGNRQQKHKSKDKLANALGKHAKKSPPKGHISHSTRSMINRFYGTEFNGFTGTQKAFIEKNLGNIYVITQRVLSRRGYPDVAKRTRQQGMQLVTFYLHPNGRISRLRLKKRLGYTSLDKNTLQVVRIAHANYPRPQTTTKITFYVEYSLD